MRVCAQTKGITKTFETWDACEIEITLYLERAGRGALMVLKKMNPLDPWDTDSPDGPPPPLTHFTKRQLDVIRCLDAGMSTYEISEALNISKRTVDKHLENIYTKLSVNNRLSALRRFHKMQQQCKK